jgi:enamine deaminase RidA (YjgF/YER057c/UK114 family)
VPHVINGASDLMHAIFGEYGAHARTAIGVASLPRGASVEVDAIFAVQN